MDDISALSLFSDYEPHAIIENTDCMKMLSSLNDESTGLVIADPPYNIGFDGGAGWDRKMPSNEWLSWCMQWIHECTRVLKPGRMLVIWGTLRTDDFMKLKLNVDDEMKSQLCPQNEIIWEHNWGGRSNANFARKHDVAWCWSKAGADLLFNADDVRIERKLKTNIRTGEAYDKGTIPTCVWPIVNHTTSADHCGWHPTTKPPALIERMIRAWSNEEDLVVDPFSGSGSTAIAALRANRDFIGSELNDDYASKSVERIRTLCAGLKVDLH